MPNEFNDEARVAERRVGFHAIWYVAILLALVGNAYLLFTTSHLGTGIKDVQKSVDEQLAKVNENIAAINAEEQQRLLSLSDEARRATEAAMQQARAEARKGNARVAAELARQQARSPS